MEKEKLERISHLSRLSRERNLTDEEIKERMELRGQYIAEMKASLKHTLDNTYIQKPDGTREKLRQKPNNQKPSNKSLKAAHRRLFQQIIFQRRFLYG